jgi:tripartite-type tricarboxylate transporter receptor subunit TctC
MLKEIAAALALALTLVAPEARAQADYPNRPVRFVVPFTPAGTTDILARVIGEKLAATFGQQFVIENRSGAGGNVGTAGVATAPPDGYTILMGTVSTHGINPTLYTNIPFDALKDFAPVAFAAAVPNVMVVNPKNVKAKTVQEFIAEAKASPRKLSFASSGSGTSIHLSGELFKRLAGVEMVHVPYRGSGPALTDLLSGQVDVMFDNMPSCIEHVRAGSLRAIAVTSAKRSPALPETPTIAESGLPDFEATSWFAVFAPAKTPRPIVEKLNTEIRKAIDTPELRARWEQLGGEARPMSPDEMGTFVKAEIEKWAAVVKTSGAKVE